jgi:transcriptional regulator GlxA family with amidase domain
MTPKERTEADVSHIGILVFNGDCLLATGIVNEVFQQANALLWPANGRAVYRVSVLSMLGGPVASSSAITLMTQGLEACSLRDFHALFIVGDDARVTSGSDPQLSNWLSGMEGTLEDWGSSVHDSCIELTPLRQATIPLYWLGTGHVSAWTLNQKAAQTALAQIATDHGEDISIRIASRLQPSVGEITKSRGEAPGLKLAIDKIDESRHWIRENLGNDISVSDAAGIAAMSVRNYLRRFKNEFGVTPLEYLLHLRFDAICAMLVETKLPVDKIARHCGMGNGDRLGRLFRKRCGMSPTEYRKLARSQSFIPL